MNAFLVLFTLGKTDVQVSIPSWNVWHKKGQAIVSKISQHIFHNLSYSKPWYVVPTHSYTCLRLLYIFYRCTWVDRLPYPVKFSFSEKATKNWKNLPFVLTLLSKNSCFVKTGGRFFQILWPSHNVLTLLKIKGPKPT